MCNIIMPILNRDILREIFIKLAKEEGFEETLKFALAGKQCLNLFFDYLHTLNSISLYSDSLKLTFPEFCWYFDYDEENVIPAFLWKRVSSICRKFVIEEYSEEHHASLISDIGEQQRLLNLKVYSKVNREVMNTLWMKSIEKFSAPVDCMMDYLDFEFGDSLKLLTIRVSKSQVGIFKDFIYGYRIQVKKVKVKFEAECGWKEILNIFSSTESNNNLISATIESLQLNFEQFMECPIASDLNLKNLFESLAIRFPMMTNFSMILKPADWIDSFSFFYQHSFPKTLEGLGKLRINPEFYRDLCGELSKQMDEANVEFDIEVTWRGEANVWDQKSPEVVKFQEIFAPDLSMMDINETDAKWRIQKDVSENKSLIIDVSINKVQQNPIKK